jgi:hypothetical protein
MRSMNLEVSCDLIWKPLFVKSESELNFPLTSFSGAYQDYLRGRVELICMQWMAGIVWKNNASKTGLLCSSGLIGANKWPLPFLTIGEAMGDRVSMITLCQFATWVFAQLMQVHLAPGIWELINELFGEVFVYSLWQGFSKCCSQNTREFRNPNLWVWP